ncbi:hypothetical protein CB1_002519012 [Camelus ferus]|nr:hypothetical protein CB1_002519012 [Camelus ferus]
MSALTHRLEIKNMAIPAMVMTPGVCPSVTTANRSPGELVKLQTLTSAGLPDSQLVGKYEVRFKRGPDGAGPARSVVESCAHEHPSEHTGLREFLLQIQAKIAEYDKSLSEHTDEGPVNLAGDGPAHLLSGLPWTSRCAVSVHMAACNTFSCSV